MILTQDEIKKMRKELNEDGIYPKILPPLGREYWSVYRIVDTLEHYLKILDDIKNIITNVKTKNEHNTKSRRFTKRRKYIYREK